MYNKLKCLFVFVLFCFCLRVKADGTYTVGAGQTYTTLKDAFDAVNAGSVTGVLVFQIAADCSETATASLNASGTGAASYSSIKIYPTGAVRTISGSIAGALIQLNGADNITIDGRINEAGSNEELVVENTDNSANSYTFIFLGDATNNTVKYCTVKGASTSATKGTIAFTTASGGGNDNNTINYCSITKSGVNIPVNAIYSSGTAANTNSSNTVSNCKIYDFSASGMLLDANTDTWTISGNSLYQSAAQTPATTYYMINCNVGSAYTITGNYFGGQAASCGGSAFTLNTSAQRFIVINFSSTVSGTNTIENNTIQNLSFTTSIATAPAFSIVRIEGGGGTYNIGSSGNSNTFGATSGTGSVSITDNGTGTTDAIGLIYSAGSGVINVTYNNFGAIALAGTHTAGRFMPLFTSSTTAATFSNNTVGNSAANNIDDGVGRTVSSLMGVRHTSSGALTCSNNTFQNFNFSTATSGDIYGVYSTTASSVTSSSNTFTTITSAHTGDFECAYVSIAGAITSSSNSINSITLSNASSQFYGFDLISSGDNITCSSNTIGSTSANNMSLAGNTTNYGIYISIPSAKTATLSGNTIQQFTLTSTGTSAKFAAIDLNGAGSVTLSNNTIADIDLATTKAAGTFSFLGVTLSNTGASNTLTNTRIRNIAMTTTGAVDVIMGGIYTSGAVSSSSIKKTKVTNFTNTATGAPEIYGIYVTSAAASWDHHNNIVLLDNGGNTNACQIIAFYSSATGTTNVYHNTYKVTGSASAGAEYSRAYLDNAAGGTTRNIKNNIFYNLRTGGTGSHRSYVNVNSGSATIDYNYHETTGNAAWNNTSYAFADFKTNSGASNDINSNGTTTINSEGGVTAGSAGTVADNGEDLTATVTTDFDGNARTNPPWRGAFETATPLPVTLVAFNAEKIKQGVKLSWITSSEINNDFFTVERSMDGIVFEHVETAKGAGNSNQLIRYTAFDYEHFEGIMYYRLKQTDFDGKYEYSEIIQVTVNAAESSLALTVFPNPLSGQQKLCVKADGLMDEKITIEIFNLTGKKCFEKLVSVIEESAIISLDISDNLSSGIYMINVSGNNQFLSSQKLIFK